MSDQLTQYGQIFINGYTNYAAYLWNEITHPHWHNYFYWLIGISLFFFCLEILSPWRKKQAIFRQDFWLDAFYMFFNFFLFSLLIYNAASDVVVNLFNDGIHLVSGFDLQAQNPLRNFPMWAILLIGFVIRDFVQWWIHRLLHRSDWLWEFHKVHHSVQEMGFAAHLRYHWMENVVYRSLEYIPLALLGIGLYDFFIIHLFTLSWGHYNHANVSVDHTIVGGILGGLLGLILVNRLLEVQLLAGATLGIKLVTFVGAIVMGSLALGRLLPFLFNSPEMHIWHHAHDLPEERRYGVNFGLTLAVWDYLFGTAYIPHNGQSIRLGFPKIKQFPKRFWEQLVHGWRRND